MFKSAVFYEMFLNICLSALSAGLSNSANATPIGATEKRGDGR
jgi:hypothetical protein